ncbi:helix-turn-helix transcriptional regulator [Humibacillus xanthopallidus]|uniref:Regulatory LuxR family protein n=1 Tax=Humibacillus xanthopallidus TaxID=412689 RepID=A0A543HGA0_9MICO|nr:helix-turn-helix transcriptional regulator [Humibacillus xanthopallidus]TQM57338.1 regulatory LuxR family protein [Humibacillus xanthopallidus]
MLLGREVERARLRELVAAVRGGRCATLLVYGEAGIGKTALLDHLASDASGCTVVRVAGVQAEMELPFAGLQQVCAQLPDLGGRLPEPQQAALEVALGRTTGGAPGRYLVGLAFLGLVTEAATQAPVLVVVDDVHWFDRESVDALAFAARRLQADAVGLVVAARTELVPGAVADLPPLEVPPLGREDARALLGSVVPRLDDAVAARIVGELHGNPLALVELARAVGPDGLAGGFRVPASGQDAPVPARIEAAYRDRASALPADTRRMLLLAAAEPTGDPALLWRAAAAESIGPSALSPAEEDGLVSVGARVVFRHPLVRSAVYGAASPEERRRVHRVLAEATDAVHDPDRHAWHLAKAVVGTDEAIATELERSAVRARARGGVVAAAAFMEESVRLTGDARCRSRRALDAAQLGELAGSADRAVAMLALAEDGPLDAVERARATHLRGRISLTVERGTDAVPLLVSAAVLMEQHDARRARDMHLEALTAALFACSDGHDIDVRSVAARARQAPDPGSRRSVTDTLLEGLATLELDGPQPAAEMLGRALEAFRSDALPDDDALRWLWLACRVAVLQWDDASWAVVAGRGTQIAREAGSLVALPAVLSSSAALQSLRGDGALARHQVEEAESLWRSVSAVAPPYGAMTVEAWRGRPDRLGRLIEDHRDGLIARGEGMGLALAAWSTALVRVAEGRYAEAFDHARAAAAYPEAIIYSRWALVELVESGVRSGHADAAAEALVRLARSTQASGTDWALGVEARCRALLADGQRAEAFYAEAVERLERTALRAESARAHLLYGEWLRRRRQRARARLHLSRAHEEFSTMGAQAFAARAAAELVSTGGYPNRGHEMSPPRLTAQEERVARLASAGSSNAEIAAQLFISRSTVDYHLRKVFEKLGVDSRTRLHLVLPSSS